MKIEDIIKLPEGKTVEFKENAESRAKILATVIAFANPVIARVFNELNLIEQWGSGIRRMIGACEEAGLSPPLFEEIGPRIRVTFFKQRVDKATIDAVDEKIINFLKKEGSLSTHEIGNLIGLSRRSVINRMSQLRNKGMIVEISTGPTDPKKLYTLREN